MLVVSMFVFSVYYTGLGDWLGQRRLGLLLGFVALVALTSLSNVEQLVIGDPVLDTSGSHARLEYTWGPAFYAFAAIEYAITAVNAGLLVRKVVRSRNLYRKISFVLFVSVLVLTGATVLSLTVSPFPHFMLVPYAYLLVGVVLLLVTVSNRFLRSLPVDRLLTLGGNRFGNVATLARTHIVEEVDTGIVVLDQDERIVDINSTAKTMIGADRAVGKSIREIASLDRVLEAGALEGFLEGGDIDAIQEEIWVDTETGDRCYEVSISELRDTRNSLAGHVVLLHDITEQKQRERSLRDRETELEAKTQSLESQKAKLEHQNERLDRFAGIVSHDLRNPLNIAQGHLQNLSAQLDGTDDAVRVEAETVETLESSQSRMADIIDDALTLARHGKAITETEPVRLSAVSEDAWTNVETGDAVWTLDTELRIEAGRDRLLTLLENLFRNAVEHGGDTVAVRVGSLDDGRGFYVEDDGPGIPDEAKSAVLDHGFTTTDDGTGFGLTIVHEVASAHGWTLDIRDSATGGVRFELMGPSLRASGTDSAAKSATRSA